MITFLPTFAEKKFPNSHLLPLLSLFPPSETVTGEPLVAWEEGTESETALITTRLLHYSDRKQTVVLCRSNNSNIAMRLVFDQFERYNYISTNAHATTLNIITAVQSITHCTHHKCSRRCNRCLDR